MNTNLMFSSISNEWETPIEFFKKLDEEFHFTLDPCSTKENHLCDKFYTIEDDGLFKDWSNEIVFANPPYGKQIGKWVEKCYNENKNNGVICVMLIPSRTDTNWFHSYIYEKADIIFLKGRLKFKNRLLPNKIQSAPFPSMIVIYDKI
jgi:phage N-6-adenine-methyltransferase